MLISIGNNSIWSIIGGTSLPLLPTGQKNFSFFIIPFSKNGINLRLSLIHIDDKLNRIKVSDKLSWMISMTVMVKYVPEIKDDTFWVCYKLSSQKVREILTYLIG